jgi:excisionase family DNA binding protein
MNEAPRLPKLNETPVYLTLDDAAKRAQVSRNTIMKFIAEGLPVCEFSSRLRRIKTSEFDAWMQATVEARRATARLVTLTEKLKLQAEREKRSVEDIQIELYSAYLERCANGARVE